MKKEIARLLSVLFTVGGLSGCAAAPKAKEYAEKEFLLSGFWMPHEVTEQAFQLYKDAGLNVLSMTNHSGERTSEGLAYLGSKKTAKSLEIAKKIGLKVNLHYGGWYYEAAEGKRMSDTPFSDYDFYGDYKDIIVGMDIADEPSAAGIELYGNDAFTADYKSVYSVPFKINLFPNYASNTQLGTNGYEEYLQSFAEEILADFPENPYISVDYYPFRKSGFSNKWLSCYESVARIARQYGATTHFYIQSATANEFDTELTEEDMRLQLYVALCYGGRELTYYCYSMPGIYTEPTYEKCLLDKNNEPTDLYYIVKELNREIQSFSSAFSAYDWVKTMGVMGEDVKDKAFDLTTEKTDFSDRKYVSSVVTERKCLVGCFEREEDEAYMLVNWGDPDATPKTTATVTLKGDASYVAVYGGKGANGVEILKSEAGKVEIPLKRGEGKFIVPLI